MIPGYVRAELEYRVYAPGAEAVIQGTDDFTELPDWVDVGIAAKGTMRFAPPPLDADVDPAMREAIDAAATMYRVVVSLPVRPFADLHVEYALEAAAEIAELSGGVVVDVPLRWVWSAEEIKARAEAAEHVDEVRIVVERDADGVRSARSLGLRKFGYAEVVATGVPPGCAEAARRLVDDACQALILGEARPDDGFEHGGAEIAIRPQAGLAGGTPGGVLELVRVDGGDFGDFLRALEAEIEAEEGPQVDEPASASALRAQRAE